MAKEEEIFGELNPGFSLWTSAHGFHHYRFHKLRLEQTIINHQPSDMMILHIIHWWRRYFENIFHTWNLASLSADQRWRRAWGLLLAVASLLLLASFTYHSYQVSPGKTNKQHQMVFQTFSSAVFSHVSLSKAEGTWPAITICERQGLSRWQVSLKLSIITDVIRFTGPWSLLLALAGNLRLTSPGAFRRTWQGIFLSERLVPAT